MRPRNFLSCVLGLALTLCAAQFSWAQYSINTIAGGGPNNLPELMASIGTTQSVVLDSAGNIYIADSWSGDVFKISTSGTLTIVAGNGTPGYSGDGGRATGASFGLGGPQAIALDPAGNVFIADTYNSVIRAVNMGTSTITIAGVSIAPGNIATVAGNFAAGPGYTGDGGPATSAQLNEPFGLYVDSSDDIFIADTDNNGIRLVTNNTGIIGTVAGGGTGCAAQTDALGDGCPALDAIFNEPERVYLDAAGNIFISDTLNSVIRVVNPGTASVTIAGITIPSGEIEIVAGTYYNSLTGSACQFTGDNGSATSAFLCLPVGLYVDSSDNVYIADTFNYAIREVSSSGTITTVAGTLGQFGYTPSSGPGTSALMNYPAGVFLDSSGDIFVADSDNYVIREVTGTTIQTVVGNNTLAYSGDGGPATSAELAFPGGVLVDAGGNVYISDTVNSVIRVYNPGSQAVTIGNVTIQPGDIQTVAGNGSTCAVPAPGGCGDGGAAISAQLNFPYGVFVDSLGNIYIADTGVTAENSVIRQVTPAGIINTIVGTLGSAGYAGDGLAPTSAQLDNPQAVAVDAAGNIFIADTGNSAIRVVNNGTQNLVIGLVTVLPGTINTVAGLPPTACDDPSSGCGDNGPANAASLNFPTGISLDSSDDIFIADSQNSAIRVVNSTTQSITIAGTTIPAGDILTVAGTLGQDGYAGDNGAPTSALLNTPFGVLVDSLGNMFIADTDNSAIREVVAIDATIETIAGTGTAAFSGDGGPATSAQLNGPEAVAVSAGNLFVADSQNSRIRQLTSTVVMSVVPSSTTLAVGGTQQYLATVTGANNTNVTWQVNGVTGGNSTVGTILASGLYTAPATAPSSAITVTAISDANGTTSASAAVTLAASDAGAISVSTTPAGVTEVYTSSTQSFTAAVTGETNTAVNWEVNTIAGGNSTIGTIDTNGNYTAPSSVPSPALVLITAVSQADSTVSGSYPIAIVTAPSAGQPAPQTISPGGTANFSLSLNANTGNPHQPITLSCLQSSIPTGSTCTFSPATITPGSSAVSFTLTVTVPSDSASLNKQPLKNGHTTLLATQISLAFSPLAGILLIGRARRNRKRWLSLALASLALFALVGCGGSSSSSHQQNPVTYNIQIQGTTAAQPSPVAITTATLTVQ